MLKGNVLDYLRKYLWYAGLGIILLLIILNCGHKDAVSPSSVDIGGLWMERYMSSSLSIPPLYDSIIVMPESSIVWRRNINQEQLPIKSVLFLGVDSSNFEVKIYRDDTLLVNQYSGIFEINQDTLRFITDKNIVQEYGYQFLSSDSVFIYDFIWQDSSGPMFFVIPSKNILWRSAYSWKTKGIFVRASEF